MGNIKFKVGGRELETYQLSDRELYDLICSGSLTDEERNALTDTMKDRFRWTLCPEPGENDDDVFVRFFSRFVNGRVHSMRKVAEGMARDHRYLQNEMFKVCMEYVKRLAENCEDGRFDPRNEYACKTSGAIVRLLKENGYYI